MVREKDNSGTISWVQTFWKFRQCARVASELWGPGLAFGVATNTIHYPSEIPSYRQVAAGQFVRCLYSMFPLIDQPE